jgi:hypothetical protein
MKKISAAIDGLKYSRSTQQYAIHLAKQSHAHLVGVFLDDFTYHSYKIYELVGAEAFAEEKLSEAEEKDKDLRSHAVEEFKNACQTAEVECTIHHDRSIAIQELLHESIYADLLLINARETLMHYEEKTPTRFIHDLLGEVQCPVLVVPKDFAPIEKLVLLYDGEPSSVYAIRTFSYLLSTLKYLPTEVIFVNNTKYSIHLPDGKLMKEFMKRHFPKATYTSLKGNPETEIVHQLKNQPAQVLVVLGAYRRGVVSRWFRPSMADILMDELQFPLFIAHNK